MNVICLLGINCISRVLCYSRCIAFPTELCARPMETQISLCIREVWSEIGQSIVSKGSKASSGGQRRQIWVFAGRNCSLIGNAASRLSILVRKKCLFSYTFLRTRREKTTLLSHYTKCIFWTAWSCVDNGGRRSQLHGTLGSSQETSSNSAGKLYSGI